MNDEERKELEQLREEVARLEDANKKLTEGCEQLVARNMMLAEKLDFYYEVRRHVEWLKDLVRRHRELMAQADLRNDEELLAIIEAKLEGDNIPLPPEYGIREVAELVGTTQTRISTLYKEKTIYHSVDKYLDFLRLMRALRMLKENPQYSIEAIQNGVSFKATGTEREETRSGKAKEHWTGVLGYKAYNRGIAKVRSVHRKLGHYRLTHTSDMADKFEKEWKEVKRAAKKKNKSE